MGELDRVDGHGGQWSVVSWQLAVVSCGRSVVPVDYRRIPCGLEMLEDSSETSRGEVHPVWIRDQATGEPPEPPVCLVTMEDRRMTER